MSTVRRDLHDRNRRSWNEATRVHNAHKVDQAGYLRRGGHTLFPEELELLGELDGRRVLHLCCNAGQDTLSLATLGADVTGVDIADEAIAFARTLSEDSGVPGRFERADVYDWLVEARGRERFDVVFLSYGALCWLSDLGRLMTDVRGVLAPGGRIVILEFHPYVMVFDRDLSLTYPYFADEPLVWDEGVSDYVGEAAGALSPSGHLDTDGPFENPHPVHEFPWTVSGLVEAVCAVPDLQVETLREYPYANGCNLGGMLVPSSGRRFIVPPDRPSLPLMLGLVARRVG